MLRKFEIAKGSCARTLVLIAHFYEASERTIGSMQPNSFSNSIYLQIHVDSLERSRPDTLELIQH